MTREEWGGYQLYCPISQDRRSDNGPTSRRQPQEDPESLESLEIRTTVLLSNVSCFSRGRSR
jgi:hypothetical protein